MGKEKKLELPKETILEMYKTMTMQEVAIECGVSLKTIQRRFKEWGIVSRGAIQSIPKTKKSKIKKVAKYKNKEEFEKVYKELKSISLVAKYFKIGFTTAYEWKCKHQIPTVKGVSEVGKAKINLNKPWSDFELLNSMYQKHSAKELSEMWGCNVTTIFDWLNKFNIPTKTSKEQWEIKPKNAKFQIGNSLNIEELIKHKTRLHSNTVRLIKEKVGECQSCGYKEVLDLHHINEDSTDNRPENHIVLCPNCHAKLHRLGVSVNELAPNYKSWDSYQGGH